MKKKVLGIGEIVLDKVHQVASFPQEGEKILAQKMALSLGGPVPAALILLSRLGAECSLVAAIGDDEAGLLIRSILKNEGIHLLEQKIDQTPVHTVLVSSETGTRTIIKDRGTMSSLKAIPKHIVRSAHLILCDRHERRAVISTLCNKLEQTPIIIDPSVDCSNETIQLLKMMTFPIIPVETVQTLFPNESIKDGAKKLALLLDKTLIVTMGKLGSAICSNDDFVLSPPFPIKAIDVLGAGDIFRGGFAWGVLEGWNISRCVQFANLVAALQCTKLGNSGAIPTQQEIISFEKSMAELSNLPVTI